MRYEKQVTEIANSNEKLMSLLQEYEEIQNQLKKALHDEDKAILWADLIELIIKISDYILESEEVVRKGVSEAMGGKVLELESERLMRIGKAEGIQQERIAAIQRMIRKGCTKNFILDLGYTEEDYAEAEVGLRQNM